MKFLNWGHFIFKLSFIFRTPDRKIVLAKSSYPDISVRFIYKRSSLHSIAPFRQYVNFGLIKSPLNSLTPRYSRIFTLGKMGFTKVSKQFS